MTPHRTVLLLAVLSTSACAPAPINRPIKGGPASGTLNVARKYLEGRWNLVSYEIMPPGRAPIHLAPPSGQGTLNYDEFSNMTMEIRVDDATAKLLDAAGIQTTNGVLSTNGRTAIDMQNKTLTFILDGQQQFTAPSGPLALSRPRHWVVNGNQLTLTTKSDDGKTTLSVGHWQKMP